MSRMVFLLNACLLGSLLPIRAAAPLVNISDIPALPDGPGQGNYAIFQGKLFDVLVTTNLNLLVYPLENGKRTGPSIEIGSCSAIPSPLLRFVSVVRLPPPVVNPAKLYFDMVTDSGTHVQQTWKLRDGSLLVDNQVNNFPPDRVPQLLIPVRFPQTHTIATNAPQAERIKATAGCTLRWRGGNGDKNLKIFTVPYANRVDQLGFCDWIEYNGPWGKRKITLKRTNNKGYFQPHDIKFAYTGLSLVFTSRPDAKNKIESQGFELKVE